MKDRVSAFPGRVKLTPVEGLENTYDLERADSPEEEGTPLNKTTFLQDVTAALAGLGEDATPDEAFTVILTRLLGLQTVVIPSSGWEGEDAPYTQAVSVPNVSDDETDQGIFIAPSSVSRKEWNRIQAQAVSQGANQLTFDAQEQTAIDLTVYVLIQGVL